MAANGFLKLPDSVAKFGAALKSGVCPPHLQMHLGIDQESEREREKQLQAGARSSAPRRHFHGTAPEFKNRRKLIFKI